jgi:hypothetical protein
MKMFPDAKILWISRNPVTTVESQVLLQDSVNRTFFLDEKEFRENDMHPPIDPNWKQRYGKTKDHWSFLVHGEYPNEHIGELWMPRVFPRTVPEHQKISEYLKQTKRNCAHAVAVAQHERVVAEAIQDPRCGLKEGDNLLILYHEDILEDASGVFEKVLEFCELDSTPEERLEWLEKQDFPGGQANKTRSSKEKVASKQHWLFKEETDEINAIVAPAMKRFQTRGNFMQRIANTKLGQK